MADKTLKIDVHTPAGKKDGSVELPAELFDAEANIALMHQVVEAQLAANCASTTWCISAMFASTSNSSAGSSTEPSFLPAGVWTSILSALAAITYRLA